MELHLYTYILKKVNLHILGNNYHYILREHPLVISTAILSESEAVT